LDGSRIKILISCWILRKIFLVSRKFLWRAKKFFQLLTFSGSFGNSRGLFSIDFGGSFGTFPASHLSLIAFSLGSWLFFQYKAVVLMLECPKTFCNTGKGMPELA
jgi:hypothetical protein